MSNRHEDQDHGEEGPAERARPRKDFWDKMDVLGRVFAGVVLVGIGVVLKTGADSVKQSLETGNLVQTLIEDLTTEGARRDVALIALNRSVGEEKRGMVAKIAERLILDIAESESDRQIYKEVRLYITALEILDEIDPHRAADLAKRVVKIKFQRDPKRARELTKYLAEVVDLSGDELVNSLRVSVSESSRMLVRQNKERIEQAKREKDTYTEQVAQAEQKEAEATLALVNAADARSKGEKSAADDYSRAAQIHQKAARDYFRKAKSLDPSRTLERRMFAR